MLKNYTIATVIQSDDYTLSNLINEVYPEIGYDSVACNEGAYECDKTFEVFGEGHPPKYDGQKSPTDEEWGEILDTKGMYQTCAIMQKMVVDGYLIAGEYVISV